MVENIHRLRFARRFRLFANRRPIHIHPLVPAGLPAHEIQILTQPVAKLDGKGVPPTNTRPFRHSSRETGSISASVCRAIPFMPSVVINGA